MACMTQAEIYHDSRDPFYRFPQGARACGETVRLRLFAPKTAVCSLRIWQQSNPVILPMQRAQEQDAMAYFEVSARMPEKPDVLWYAFLVELDGKSLWYGNARDGLGGVGFLYEGEGKSYQITVYEDGFETPDWLHEGILYQIFPDRFYVGEQSLLYKRDHIYAHESWEEKPLPIKEPETWENYPYDFFGGNLQGIEEKLPYLQNLGVTVVYLNPIFKAASNHKYDTGDYHQIDPSFGTNEDFSRLCKKAKEYGIRILLDGVFSHTGEDSLYFNKYGHYPGLGAYQSTKSPYYGWYKFRRHPDDYVSWWGVKTLPETNEDDPSLRSFLLTGENAVAIKWLRLGASGWRLDVADELPDDFLEDLRTRVKGEFSDAAIIGEVWEDATNKISYGRLRNFAFGNSLDSTMHYPLRNELLNFFLFHIDANELKRRLLCHKENYPPQMLFALMTLMGSHDRERIINILAGNTGIGLAPDQLRELALSPAEYEKGKKSLMALFAVICALPGMPAIYYGDEAGMQGAADPFCRGPYPWGREDTEIQGCFKALIHRRKANKAWTLGHVDIDAPERDVLVIRRFIQGGLDALNHPARDARGLFLLNRGPKIVTIEENGRRYTLKPMQPVWEEN